MRTRLLIAAVAVLAAGIAAIVVGGGDENPPPRPPAATPSPAPTPTPTPTPPPGPALEQAKDGPSLAVGITEPNPSFVFADRDVAPEFVRWRDELAAIRPELYRVTVDWSVLQPSAGVEPNLDSPHHGCMRALPPCAAFAGVRDQLRALAERQREGGWQALVVMTGTPDWAGRSASGCREDANDGAPRADMLPQYRRVIAAVLAAAGQEGATLRYWSPWNEPNHPYFLSPQRAACDPGARSLAGRPYAALARAMRAELAAQPGDQVLVLGETAAALERSRRATTVEELIRALPRDLVCAAPVWSQHAYIGGTDPVPTVTRALDALGCPRPPVVWVTETGVGEAPEGLSFAQAVAADRDGCLELHRQLVTWYENPRVALAVQYTLREDDQFPTGLVTTDLARARPALGEWKAWGGGRDPAAPPPAPAC